MNIKRISGIMKIQKSIIIVSALLLMAGCQSTTSEEDIQESINKKKTEVARLQEEIKSLKDQLKADSAYAVPVYTKEIKPEVFSHMIEVNGSAEAVEQANISPEVNGQIKEILVEEGDRVKKGQLLARLNTDVNQKNIQEIKTSLELAKTTYEKQKKLWEQKIGSEIEYLQARNQKESLESRLETMKAQLNMALVRAPFSGIIDDIMKKEGDLALPGNPMINLINLTRLKINADISESYLSSIKEGDSVQLEFPAYPGIQLKAPIFRTGNIIKPANRTFEIQLKINNIDEKLKPNIITVLHINDYTNSKALTVPSIIIKRDMQGEFIFVAKKNANNQLIAEKRYVTTGKSFQEKTEILQGLEPGELAITEGYNMVSTGSLVEEK